MNTKKEIFEKIDEVKEEVLLGDVVKVLRALNEDIDEVIEVSQRTQEASICLAPTGALTAVTIMRYGSSMVFDGLLWCSLQS